MEKNRIQKTNPDTATFTVREKKKIRNHKEVSISCDLVTKKLFL